MTALIPPEAFNAVVTTLRNFFLDLGFVEVHTQNRLSILAACEDPATVSTFRYGGKTWPLPQTGQMWLEHELLRNPALRGVFCVSTSYRQEPNPIVGRHDTIFPMFEFEAPGGMDRMESLERLLCEHLGFGKADKFRRMKYEDAARIYEVREIGYEEEFKICSDNNGVVFLSDFPYHTSPFWNMKRNGHTANKIDVLLKGMETIGSAERSSDVDEMRHQFNTISDGEYAGLLYKKFGKRRVNAELDEFLSHDFFPRFGGGIGLTRLIKALTLNA